MSILTSALISLGLGFFVSLRGHPLSPAAVTCFVSGMNMLVFFGIYQLEIGVDQLGRFWGLSARYSEKSLAICAVLYLFVSVVAIIAHAYNGPKDISQSILYRNHKNSKNIKLISSDFLNRLLHGWAALVAWYVLASALILHAIQIDWSYLFSYHTYLAVRDPQAIGINSELFYPLHAALPVLTIVAAVVLPFYVRARSLLFIGFAIPVFIYLLFHQIAASSRVSAFSIFIVAVLFQVTSRHRISKLAIILTTLGCYLLGLMLESRGHGRFGIGPVLELAVSGGGEFDAALVQSIRGLFGGGFVLAEAVSRSGISYPHSYKLLSYLSTSSTLDGFAALRAAYEHRITAFAPFSALAEAWHFGTIYFVAFFVCLWVSISRINNIWRKFGVRAGIFVAFPYYVFVVGMNMYPLRNSIRFLIISVLLTYAVSYFFRLQRYYDSRAMDFRQ